jgi:hypothetical protein
MGISHDANFAAWRYDEPEPQNETRLKDDLSIGFEKKEGLIAADMVGAFDAISQLTDFVATSSEEEFTALRGRSISLRRRLRMV